MKTNLTPRVPLVPALTGLDAYRVPSHPAPVELQLSGNEGPEIPAGLRQFEDPSGEIVRSYPRTGEVELELAARWNLQPDQLLLTGGADDALARAISLVAAPGREVVIPTPTFEMIERFIRLMGAGQRSVPWWGGGLPVDELLSSLTERTVAAVLVSPNNPTGLAASGEEIERLLSGLGNRLLIVDQAYCEFADEDPTALLAGRPNVILTRTLSKAFGLAGLRIGVAIASADLVALLRAVGQPYPVAGPSLAIARQVLTDQGSWQDSYLTQIREHRGRLVEILEDLGQRPLPSQANFVLCELDEPDWVSDGLAGLGVAVRRFPHREDLVRSLRITVPGTKSDMERLDRSLRTVLAPQALLFDMDGVLADVTSSYRRAIRETAAAFGVPVTDDDIEAAKAAGDANNDWVLTWRLVARQRSGVDLEEVREAFETRYQGTPEKPGLWLEESLLIPRPQLEALAARLPLAIVTGRPRRDAERFLQTFDLGDLFQVVISMEDGPAKPDPFPVQRALHELGLERAWLLGDTPDDIQAARAAGVVPLGFVAREKAAAIGPTLLSSGAARVLTDLTDVLGRLPALRFQGDK
jgi:histidinol-phosphate aminotransferase